MYITYIDIHIHIIFIDPVFFKVRIVLLKHSVIDN